MDASQHVKIEQSFDAIRLLLAPVTAVIGGDLEKYQNHVFRVFANCLSIDSNEVNRNKYEIAAAFHDIGIWTDNTIDYLAPSVIIATRYLNDSSQQALIPEIVAMIEWHHKTTSYKGEFGGTVNTFRQADWMDVSLGILSFDSD